MKQRKQQKNTKKEKIILTPPTNGRFYRPITHIENGIKRFFYARPKKGQQILPISKKI